MSTIYQQFISYFHQKAERVIIRRITIGIGYTFVSLEHGGMGVSYTWLDTNTQCQALQHYTNMEGQSASLALRLMTSEKPLERSIALACINALNYENAFLLPQDTDNTVLYSALDITSSSKIAMVGQFKPLLKHFEQVEASAKLIDYHHTIGTKGEFFHSLKHWANTVIVTATSLLNNTFEEIMEHVPSSCKAVLLGPSTPMTPELFSSFPITLLAGTVPEDAYEVERVIRHGNGTYYIQKYGRKVYSFVH